MSGMGAEAVLLPPSRWSRKTVSDAMASYDDYSVTLPSQGKDIRLCGYSLDLENDSAENTYYIMRWNGNGFRLDQMREEDW